MTTAGDVHTQTGMSANIFFVNTSMVDEYFYNADGELMIVPQEGELRFFTELGKIDIAPGEIAIIPRGMKFKVEVLKGAARGYMCENYGAKFTLPDR
jgi:homogentisate 1,2-dioxygenase